MLTPARDTPTYTLFASQHPRPGTQKRGPETAFTGILFAIIRLKDKKTDIAISVNVPHVKGEYEETSVNLNEKIEGPLLAQAREIRDAILQTLQVKDWSLFADE